MKKMTIMCMAALLVLTVSCKKGKETYSGGGFRATTESHTGDADSKTQLNGDLSVTWSSGDAIKVFNADAEGKEFSTTGTGTEVDFEPTGNVTDAFFKEPYTAFYPASAATGSNQIKLEETQQYTTFDDGNRNKVLTFARGENPMAASSTTTELSFKNLCGILKFQFWSENSCTVKSLRLTSLKTGEQLWGTGTVTFDGQEATLGALSNGGASVVLDCGEEGVALHDISQPTEFLVVIPGGALSEGFTVTVTATDDSGDKVWSRTANANNIITKSKIKAMPPLPVVPHTPVLATTAIFAECEGCIYTLSGTVTLPDEKEAYKCEYGFVYSTTEVEPTVENATKSVVHQMSDASVSGTVDFDNDFPEIALDQPATRYYFRTYAITEDGVAYSDEVKEMDTPYPVQWENGQSPKSFTVSGGKKVYFSPGNLQYLAQGGSGGNAISGNPSSGQSVGGTWRFAEHQYDMCDKNTTPNHVTSDYTQASTKWIDLFGWGTSGIRHRATYYKPWETAKEDPTKYNVYGDTKCNLEDRTGTADWGKANTISNNSNTGWHVMTSNDFIALIGQLYEWGYYEGDGVEPDPRDNCGILFGKGKVGECIPGLIILPDDWEWTGDVAQFGPDVEDASRKWQPGPDTGGWPNVYSYYEWSLMEAAGAVFLPAAGYRYGNKVCVGENLPEGYEGAVFHTGNYWSSTHNETRNACSLYFTAWGIASQAFYARLYGYSVRLVRDAN